MRFFAVLGAVAASTLTIQSAHAEFLVPDAVTPPFDGWSRGDSNSTYAEWDTFTAANDVDGVNLPDIGASGPGSPTLTQTALDPGGFAILASSGNIYSFNSRTSFDIEVPSYDLGAGYNTRVVAQTRTLGNVPDLDSIALTYNDGNADVTVAPEYVLQQNVTEGDFAGLISTFGWDVSGLNPEGFSFAFAAAGSSMSLANIAVDTYTQTGAFAAFPTVIPEPTAAVLIVIGLALAPATGRVARV